AIARETATACSLEGGDQAVQAFAAWLQRIRPSAREAAEAVERAVLRTAEARAVVAAARAAAEAAETLVARRAAEREMDRSRAEQRALDEVAGAGRNARTERQRPGLPAGKE
ncbi:MAG TPA: flagellar FliJ family protein, partial [Acetobacteraceae bacterium]|nr:flagellar FliJ family protein [Acetobacteraceae bacterium]